MLFVAWSALALGLASLWRWLVGTEEQPLVAPAIAGGASLAASIVLGCAIAALAPGVGGATGGRGSATSRYASGWLQALPWLTWLLMPTVAAVVLDGRYGDDAAVVPMIAAGLVAVGLSLSERHGAAVGVGAGWLVALTAAVWVPPPWPELAFAALALIGPGEIARSWLVSADAVRRPRRRGRTVAHGTVLALLSVLLLLMVPPPPDPPQPMRTVALPYLAPAWVPRVEVFEDRRRDRASLELSGGVTADAVPGAWSGSVDVARPAEWRGSVSALLDVAVVAPTIATDAVRHAVEAEPVTRGDATEPLPGLPGGWSGRTRTSVSSQTVTAAGRHGNVVVRVVSRQVAPVIDATGDVRDLAHRIAARGIVTVAADTDPLR